MKKLWQLGFMLVMAFTLLVGCGQSDSKKPEAENNKTTQSANKSATYPMTVTDDTGNKVEFKQEPTKMVSLMPSNTEILFALGLDDHVIGVTDNDTYPEAATKKDKVGGMELNIEKIISLKPDAVFAHGMIAESAKSGIQQLRDAGIPVFVVKNASNFEETYESIKTIGKITNRSAKADQIVEDMKAKVKDVQAKVADVKKRNVFVENSDEPEIYTAGKDTFMQEILNLANVKNVADDQSGWFKIDPEEIIKRDPDVYLITYNYVPNIVEKVKKRQGFKDLKAIKNDRVVQVDPDKTSRPGPRLAEGLEEVAKAVYPEAFK
ncbi:ABC transporter substrate-binding protein [Rummeliibacillus stabekisii]|uniref:ABC transporter substrate-binding protein n=1 Tax=Rummeliibacillus stabekisii TaxID=241244 RepID=UPI0011665180|nr:ABC transporter substrate-binding protein [Rummeliibacillus stabekisii]MBB5170539.1 iron complex transport system substrate-binding protein [Rummeliibacillus stabekisii]GEL04793.1 putative ABC transporter substrate-binding lipoprotein YvrC [Rummeliibacillus stabekisii]